MAASKTFIPQGLHNVDGGVQLLDRPVKVGRVALTLCTLQIETSVNECGASLQRSADRPVAIP